MKTQGGNLGQVNADIGKITFDTLQKFDIPYDEIYFGKPYADFYIDDLGINCFNSLEKSLGFYNQIIQPREFNNIEINNLPIVTKKSEDLSGEIFYYKNIPLELKDLFPLFVSSKGQSEYSIERLDGLTVSELYSSKLLTENTLKHIMNSIERIQRYNINVESIIDSDIYLNYEKKIDDRYSSYDYSKFPDSKQIYVRLKQELQNYERENNGKIKLIHGDPVFSNIIINSHDKIKFIDMRGKLGSKLTILGDWLYDWSKIYQSILGYDFILLDKEIDVEYINKMKLFFKNEFISRNSEEDFKHLELITNSLLFTLIPLHNNDKCEKYYNLININ